MFNITVAVCDECGEEMSIHGLIDRNIQEVDEQYRAYEGIVSIDDIEKLMKIYKIGKAPLSLALGFGEVTITRYLSGQIPSKEYSDIMKMALSSPAFMKEKLHENKEKIALFYSGESYALNGKPMFFENCQAWVHGPVYPEVYDIFRDFKYNPIEDARFAIFEGVEDELTDEEYRVIDLVVNTFGEYGGKMLEKITHEEIPWKLARKGYADNIPSNEPITMESIEEYYVEKNMEYDFSTEEGLKKYIRDIF